MLLLPVLAALSGLVLPSNLTQVATATPASATAPEPRPKGDDDPGKQTGPRASIELDELYKQIVAAKKNALTLPSDPLRWPTITVNGKPVTSEFIAIVNLYMSGEQALQALKLGVAIEREIDKAKKAGMDTSHVDMSDAAFQAAVTEFKKNIERVYPDTTWDQYLVRNQLTEKGFETAFRAQYLFDKFLTPKDASKWPPITLEVAKGMRPGADEKQIAEFIEQLKAALTSAEPKQAMFFLIFMFRQQMNKKLIEGTPVKDLMDGIGPGLGFDIDGRKFPVAELYARGLGLNSYFESTKAIQFAAIREAVKQAILAREESDWAAAKADAATSRAKGGDVKDPERPKYWLEEGSDDFKAAFDADVKKFPPTPPFDHPRMVHFRKFPSMYIYRMYFQMIDAYSRMTKNERTLDTIQKHVERDALFFSSGQAEVEAIAFSVQPDPSKGKIVGTIEEGFQLARQGAEKAVTDLREGARLSEEARKKAKDAGKTDEEVDKAAAEAAKGLTFRDVLERDSDYKDAPARANMPPPPSNFRGKFGPLQRNPLTEKFGESEITNLLCGYMIGESLFFRAPLNEVFGPIRGTTAYYVVRVVSRAPGGKVTELKEDSQRQLAEDDYINHAFQDFVNEAVSKAKIAVKF